MGARTMCGRVANMRTAGVFLLLLVGVAGKSAPPDPVSAAQGRLPGLTGARPLDDRFAAPLDDRDNFFDGAEPDDIDVTAKIPKAVTENSTVRMTCDYNLYSMPLYAVKWYKRDDEFYRFIPKELPAKSVFHPLGDKVDIERSDEHNLIIRDVGPAEAGKYRCEVTADSSFITRAVSGYMHVVRLPQGNVTARTEKRRYALGETLRGNCTAPPARPPANITWTVNGLPVNSSYEKYFSIGNLTEYRNMAYAVAGIEFELVPENFINGRLTVVCRADIFQLYKARATLAIDEERPRLASVLGTRESSHNRSTAGSMEGWLLMLVIADILLGNIR